MTDAATVKATRLPCGLEVLHNAALRPILGDIFGITWDDTRLYYAKGRQVFASDASGVPVDTGYDSGASIGVGFVNYLHQLVHHNGLLYIANTAKTKVDVWDIAQARLVGSYTSPTEGLSYANSVLVTDYVYVMHHNKGDSVLSVFDKATRALVAEYTGIGNKCHNVADLGDRIGWLDSGGCKFRTIAKADGARAAYDLDMCCTHMERPFVRGLSMVGDVVLVGATEWHEQRQLRRNSTVVSFDASFSRIRTEAVCPDDGLREIRARGVDKAHHNTVSDWPAWLTSEG